MSSPEPWSERELRILEALWRQGKTAEQISRFLVTRSRDAVCGRVRRLRKRLGKRGPAVRGSPMQWHCGT